MAAAAAPTSLLPLRPALRVSSVRDRDSRQYGKQHLVDGSAETCWTSDAERGRSPSRQGRPQWVHVAFETPVQQVARLVLCFQGGFVGTPCDVFVAAGDAAAAADAPLTLLTTVAPADANAVQSFDLPPAAGPVRALRLVFRDSTDLFGRVTLYTLDLLGAP